MCIPTANGAAFLGTSSLISQGLGVVNDSVGAALAADGERSNQRLQAFFARLNSETELDNAREALRQGEFAEQRQRMETAQLKSRQRAAMGANGVALDEGSALIRQVSTDFVGEVDANNIRANAARSAAGNRSRAAGLRGEATMREAAARSISPLTVGLTSLATGASRVAGNWYRMDSAGVFGDGGGGGGGYDGRGQPRGSGRPPVWGEAGHENVEVRSTFDVFRRARRVSVGPGGF